MAETDPSGHVMYTYPPSVEAGGEVNVHSVKISFDEEESEREA